MIKQRAGAAKVVIVAMLAALAVVLALPLAASAAPPENPHGAGVCLSQVAIQPEAVGANRLGDAVSSLAAQGGSVPALIDSARGDGANGCGAPPGPRHLG